MKKQVNNGQHSFLFWLIVPLVFLWLSVGYLIGFVKDKPSWLSGKTPVESEVTDPYFQEYMLIEGGLNQGLVTFWFDDAWLSQYLNAYPILKKNNYKASLAVPTDAIEKPNYMNWSQVKVLLRDGWEISNHSRSHDCEMDKWNREKVEYEYRTSKLILWKNKLPSDIFVSPCGVDSEVMREEVKKHFIAYRTVDPGFNDLNEIDFYNLKVRNIDKVTTIEEIEGWINHAKENKQWVIFVFHRVGDSGKQISDDTFNTSLSDFENIVSLVKTSGLQVVVPSQVLSTLIK